MRNFKFRQHLLKVLLMLALVFVGDHAQQCHAVRLNSNGGYDIVIGVEDSTIEPLSVNQFLDDIRLGMEQFSTELWKITKRRFFINSVDVLVPGNWWTVSKFETATWQTLLDSEIRISHDVGSPTAVNPNACGTAGLYVELPDNFFKTIRGGQYGPIGKALVNVWARYRYGVHEEHGMPGDIKFPYFYAHPSFEPKWEATGCSNEEIIGSFRTIDGEESERCDPYGSKGPDDDCRFVPSPSNTANSSMMHLHWLDSMTEFCDSKTHNHAAPNRQNLFCGHRSVWEVIRESEDYKSTTSCMDSIGRPNFRVLKESKSPEFYILLDRGKTVTPEKVLQEVMGAVIKFITYPSLERVNIAVGTYPHSNQGRDHYYVKEEVGWAPISSEIYEIERVLNASATPDGPVIRDFGLAIQEVAETIKRRNHLAGTVILVIKRGASPNLFDKISFEQEVIASIQEDSRIKVFAIEAQQGEKMPYTNLQTLTEATTGQYHLINDTMNTAKKLAKILSTVQEKLEQPNIMNSISTWTIQKQYTEAEKSIEIPIYDNANVVKIHLTANKDMVGSKITLEQLSGYHDTMQSSVKGEWDENSDLTKRLVFTYTINNPTPGSIWSLKHGCHTEKLSECRFFLLVTAHNDKPTPRTDEIIFNSQSINIDISTSAIEHHYVDMSELGVRLVPFAIYAKIEMEQQRVLILDNVTALVRLAGEHDNHLGDWIIPLKDDGTGLPDVAGHDGIYSGIFTPLEDGLYQISVAASGISEPGGSAFQDLRIVNHAGSLMQIHQLNFGCKNSSKPRCISAVPRGSFSRVQDMQRTVFVENAPTFKPGKPTRILDFSVTAFPNFDLEFAFTSPRLLGSDADPEEFRIYMAPHVDNFIGSTDVTKLLITMRGEPAGSQVKVHFNAGSKAIPFYAVEASYEGQKGGPSNVVGIVPSEGGPIVPSPTTTPKSSSPIPSGPTTTTEFPWPSTTPTTPYPTTSSEEEEESEETTFPVTSSTTTQSPEPSTVQTTLAPTTTTESEMSSIIPTETTSTTENPEISSTAPTTLPPSTTTDSEISSIVPTETTSTTENPEISSTVPTTLSPSTTTDSEMSSIVPTVTTSTTENPEISSTVPTTLSPSTTTDSEMSSIVPTVTTSTTENPEISSTVPTTISPSTTTESEISSTVSNTMSPSTTTESEVSSIVPTQITSTTENPEISSTAPTTLSPSTTTDSEMSSIVPTQITSTTENPEVSSTVPTTLSPSTTTESEISSVAPTLTTSTTENPEISSTSSTTLSPSSTTESDISSTISTTFTPSTTEDPEISSTAPTTLPPSTSTESDISSIVPTQTSSTTENPEISSTVPTTSAPSTTTDSEMSSIVPTQSSSTTENPEISSTVPTTSAPSTTTESEMSSIVPTQTSSTTENPEISSTVPTTLSPSTSSTTEDVSTTKEPEITTSERITETSVITSTETISSTTSPVTSTISTSVAPPSSTPDEDVTVPPSTPEPTTSSLSTSETVSTPSTPNTEPSVSGSFKLTVSDITISLTTIFILYWRIVL